MLRQDNTPTDPPLPTDARDDKIVPFRSGSGIAGVLIVGLCLFQSDARRFEDCALTTALEHGVTKNRWFAFRSGSPNPRVADLNIAYFHARKLV